jgi:ATP-dependent Clp protease ATP-binding subunit ClpA
VGKTEFAVTLAEFLTTRKDRLLRIDCSEYSEAHQVARLLGAPPSYLGYGAPPIIEDFARGTAHGVVLFDEFEKADAALHRLCLQAFDAGRLTTSAGKTVDLSRMVMIATANVRASDQRVPVGFHAITQADSLDKDPAPPIAALGRVFAAELLNRFDRIIGFRPIGRETAYRILRERLLPAVRERVRERYGVGLAIERAVEDLVIAQGYSEEFGARHLQRALSSLVLRPLAEAASSLPAGCSSLVVSARVEVGLDLPVTPRVQHQRVLVSV